MILGSNAVLFNPGSTKTSKQTFQQFANKKLSSDIFFFVKFWFGWTYENKTTGPGIRLTGFMTKFVESNKPSVFRTKSIPDEVPADYDLILSCTTNKKWTITFDKVQPYD
jgi:hypothetical protein